MHNSHSPLSRSFEPTARTLAAGQLDKIPEVSIVLTKFDLIFAIRLRLVRLSCFDRCIARHRRIPPRIVRRGLFFLLNLEAVRENMRFDLRLFNFLRKAMVFPLRVDGVINSSLFFNLLQGFFSDGVSLRTDNIKVVSVRSKDYAPTGGALLV